MVLSDAPRKKDPRSLPPSLSPSFHPPLPPLSRSLIRWEQVPTEEGCISLAGVAQEWMGEREWRWGGESSRRCNYSATASLHIPELKDDRGVETCLWCSNERKEWQGCRITSAPWLKVTDFNYFGSEHHLDLMFLWLSSNHYLNLCIIGLIYCGLFQDVYCCLAKRHPLRGKWSHLL